MCESVHLDGHGFGRFARQHRRFERQLLLGANRHIVARHDAARREDLLQAGGDIGFGGVHALIERLHHQIVAIAIHHQRGQQVGFAVHHAIRVGFADHFAAMRFSRPQPAQIKIAADLFDVPRKHAQSDLRSGAVVCRAERPPALVRDSYSFARLGAVPIRDVARKDPRVPGGDAIGRLPVDPHFVHRWACSRAMRFSVEGCVENRFIRLLPVNGWMMNMWAVAGEASMGMRFD